MQCGGASRLQSLSAEAWRAVESQYQLATRKLVDSAAEQEIIEQLIETAKPPDRAPARLHYLLFTPFRYPPLPHGSRFGTRHEPGIWYGSHTHRTVFAEVAYYRLLFLEGTTADLGLLQTALTVFRTALRTKSGIDLTALPFAAHEAVLASRTSYAATQALGRDMRSAGVEAFFYRSARDAEGGINIGVFTPAPFGRRAPRSLESWHCVATRGRVEVVRRDYLGRALYSFAREEFLVDGRLPAPAV